MEITIIKMLKAITDSRKTCCCFGFCLLSQKFLFCLLFLLTLLRIVGLEAITPWVLGGLAAVLAINYLTSSFEYSVMREYFVQRFRLEERHNICHIVMFCPICVTYQMHSELEYQKNNPEFNNNPLPYELIP